MNEKEIATDIALIIADCLQHPRIFSTISTAWLISKKLPEEICCKALKAMINEAIDFCKTDPKWKGQLKGFEKLSKELDIIISKI